MNHSALKKFAAEARNALIEQVSTRLENVLQSDSVAIREQEAQVKQLREALKSHSQKELAERVAYLWFNRFTALRFMDADQRHPFACRVLTAAGDHTQPEILAQVRAAAPPEGIQLDHQRIDDLLDGKIPSTNPQEEVYRQLILASCNYYHQLMPFVFEKLEDYTELLLPTDLLSENSILHGFRTAITDADCEEVELIGWLYQYYIAEKKDAVMARKSAVPKEDIPAVTQLFTPHWIVRYMVENSLGHLWIRSRPTSRLREKMPYYIEESQENANPSETKNSSFPIPHSPLSVGSPEEIRLIDPACGSGHILTYAFDLLHAIYEEEGYEPAEIPQLILTHNLHGVEIDERAAELAYFALIMKAQQHHRRFLRRQLRANPKERIVPNICCLEEIHFDDGELKAYMDALDLGALFTEPVLKLMHQFQHAKNFGSLITPHHTPEQLAELAAKIPNSEFLIRNSSDLFLKATHSKVLKALKQAEFLSQRYHCAIANPPYMGGKAMNGPIKQFAKDKFKDSKSDLFAMFIERGFDLVNTGGFSAMVTMQSWMFLSSYEKLRERILNTKTISCLMHMDNMVMRIAFGTSATVFENQPNPGYKGAYCWVELADIGSKGIPTQFPPQNSRNLAAKQ